MRLFLNSVLNIYELLYEDKTQWNKTFIPPVCLIDFEYDGTVTIWGDRERNWEKRGIYIWFSCIYYYCYKPHILLFHVCRENRKEINKLLRKIDIAIETIGNVESRERCSGKRLNDKLDSIRKRIIEVSITVFGICLFFDSEGLIILITMVFIFRNEIKELVTGTC